MTELIASRPPALRTVINRHGQVSLLPALTTLVLLGSVCFNAALAIIDGHVMVASSAMVIAAQAAFVSAAMYIALLGWRSEMTPVAALIVMLVLFAIVRAAATGVAQPKYLGDTLIIPTFLLLGMASGATNLVRTVLILHAIVFAVFLLEALAPSIYSELFRIQDYYVNTRGNSVSEFYNSNSDLFISATRPNERFLPFIDEQRLSSIFLEPVSLGNYCTIIVAFIAASFRRMTGATLAFLAISTIAMLFGCDGRFAVVCSLLIIIVSFISSRLPPHSAIIYLPAAALVMFLIIGSVAIQAGGDDFIGRIAHTKGLLMRFDIGEFLGFADRCIDEAMDSGIAYLIITQSLPGLVLLWMFIAWGPVERTTEQIRYTHALCLYLALSMLVSYSFLSIKTGAVLWFIQGALQTGIERKSQRKHPYPEDDIRPLPKEAS